MFRVDVNGQLVGPAYPTFNDARWVGKRLQEAYPDAKVGVEGAGRYTLMSKCTEGAPR